MTTRVIYHIVHSCDKKLIIDKVFKRTVTIFFEKIFYFQNPSAQVYFNRFCPLCSIIFLNDTNTNCRAKNFPFCNDICSDEMINASSGVTTNHHNNFLAFFQVPQRNLAWKLNENNNSSINSKNPREYLLRFKKNDRFLNINLFELFSKILQQMKGESKEELEENWGGPDAFKLIIFLNDNFKDVVNNSPSILVFFSARWCAHCQQLRKPFGKAALMAKEANLSISFATIDVNQNPDIADANDVVGIPTLKYYRNGKFISNYKGKRTAEDIFEFVKNPPRKATSEETMEL